MRFEFVQAEQDLEDILIEGILTFGKIKALKYHESFKRTFKRTFELLAYLPTIGRKSERISSLNERRFLHGKHVIYYAIDQKYIIIRTIIHGATIKDIWGD